MGEQEETEEETPLDDLFEEDLEFYNMDFPAVN